MYVVSPASVANNDGSFLIDWADAYGMLAQGDYRIGIVFEGNVDARISLSTWGYFSIK